MERRLGVVGSYFFRRSTWDVAFMRELAAAGCDVGYHYEELATVVKERGAASAAEARALIGAARDRLRTTVPELRARTGLTSTSSPRMATSPTGPSASRTWSCSPIPPCGRSSACAWRPTTSSRTSRRGSSDGIPPRGWQPEDPMHAILRGEAVVAVLLHPAVLGRGARGQRPRRPRPAARGLRLPAAARPAPALTGRPCPPGGSATSPRSIRSETTGYCTRSACRCGRRLRRSR